MSEIREGQKTKLFFKSAGNIEKDFDCTIKNIYNDRISLTFPNEMMSNADYLEEGSDIFVKIFTPSGVRMFDAVVLNSPLEKEFVVEYVEDNIQVQRRAYSRSELITKLIVEKPNGENIVTHTLDIGGGGLRFFSEGHFFENQIVNCRLYLPKQITSIQAQGTILKKPHLKENEYVILFTKINELDRDRIIRKCFEIEAEMYNKM